MNSPLPSEVADMMSPTPPTTPDVATTPGGSNGEYKCGRTSEQTSIMVHAFGSMHKLRRSRWCGLYMLCARWLIRFSTAELHCCSARVELAAHAALCYTAVTWPVIDSQLFQVSYFPSHSWHFAAFEEGWGKVVEGETRATQAAGGDTDFAHSKNYSNADAHIASYGSYPTLYSNDKETQLEAVVDDRSAAAEPEAESPAADAETPATDSSSGSPSGDAAADIDAAGVIAQAQYAAGDAAEAVQETAAEVHAAGERAVHELATAGNAAAEMLEESLGMDEQLQGADDSTAQQSDDAEARRHRVLLEEGEKIAADIE